jgi:hypothetical protein
VQPVIVLIAHAPVAVLQHTPAGHGSGLHTPAGLYVQPDGQVPPTVMRQARVTLSQHDPRHGLLVQVVPAPWWWKLAPPQFEPVCIVQTPVAMLQHAPRHELGEQVVPGPA